jgi:transcriptional regulator GlxA family with amidase domain
MRTASDLNRYARPKRDDNKEDATVHGQRRQSHPPLRIGIVAPQDAQTLDVIGPVDAFTEVNRLSVTIPSYKVEILGTSDGPITMASGVRLLPDLIIGGDTEPFDTILVAGSPNFRRSIEDRTLLNWLVDVAPNTRRIGSICNGAFVLAAAGLLTGRRATTHWQSAKQLAAMFPDVRVDPDCLFVRDGPARRAARAGCRYRS